MSLAATNYSASNPFGQGLQWLKDPANWQGAAGIPARIIEHLGYSGLVLLISLVIAVPVGLYVGHTGKGRVVVVSLSGLLRALPTLGIMTLFALMATSTLSLMPAIWALVLLAVPPILTGTYAGISAVEPGIVDSARSMGMTEWQVLLRVEVPNGLAVMLGGFRSAVLQVVATVAVVAFISLGGLGRFIIDGLAVQDYGQVLGGAVVIAVLAIVIDGLLALLQRFAVSPGLQVSRHIPADIAPGSEQLASGSEPFAARTTGGTP
ncbi:ABC transporter permease [Arthrobacter livingstonensis]|uniref:ABC transporter permease n=1 Tax=Arthrobacter livingstonensis TaxID=670078 RepID=A0A2V5L201_9MICC|nr:ABC transporter permease [Arthrobacter livingstonensis]PYI65351.1 ABC transporter permease [Arthrobacter livingstonensis]